MRSMLSQVSRLAGSLCLRLFFSLLLGAMKAIHHGHEERVKVSMGLPWYFVMYKSTTAVF